MKNNWLFTVVALAALFSTGLGEGTAAALEGEAPPAGIQERLDALEQKTKILERRYEVDQENASAKALGTPSAAAAGKDGFALKSTDGNFTLKFTGLLQFDVRKYLSDKTSSLTDQLLLRRVRPVFEGTLAQYAEFKMVPDFGGGAAVLQDAYVDLKYFPAAKLRFGKYKQPVGLERLQSASQLTFVENALPTALTPNYDVGVQLFGDVLCGTLNYALSVYNGVADGASADGDANDNKDFAARVFALPFKQGSSAPLKNLGLGVGASVGKGKGTAAAAGLPSYKTNGQQTFLSYRADVVADGKRARYAPQAYWYPGRAGFLAEYILSTQEVKRSAAVVTTAQLFNRAWQAAVSYVVTGEQASFKGVKPRNVISPAQKTWGALELAARYSQLAADKDNFARYFDAAKSAATARAWTGGFNWYLNDNVKFSSSYEYTWFDGGAASGNRPTERALLSRLQTAF